MLLKMCIFFYFSACYLLVLSVCSVCNLLINSCIDALSLSLSPPSPLLIQSLPVSSSDVSLSHFFSLAKATTLFRKQTKAIVWGMQTRAVQGMLDFDYVCSRDEPSVTAMVYPFT